MPPHKNGRLKPEGAIPQWVKNEDLHMRVKHEIQLLQYQVRMYDREIHLQEKRLKNLTAGQERRLKAFDLRYHSREAIDQAYIIGALTDLEYMQQRSWLWQVYSDRGYNARLEWLRGERQKAQTKLDRITEWRSQRYREAQKRHQKKRRERNWVKMYRRRVRKREKDAALKARWEKYGIG